MTDWLGQPLLDLDGLDLDGARSVSYLLHQVFRYEYDGPAYDVRQRLVALPRPRHGSLHRRSRHVSVADPGGIQHRPSVRADDDGNEIVSVELPVVPSAVEFTLAALVERTGPAADPLLPADALTTPRHLVPTRLTSPSPELRDLAGELRAAYPADAELAEALSLRLRAEFSFAFDATSVFTTAAEAYAIRRGVCQDYAHVMLTVCRLAGIPARYVSGHLLGEQGGSHAWVEVFVRDGTGARALAFDPTNGCRAGSRHLPVAVGPDYAAVAPTSGVYSGAATGTLTWTKRAGVTAVGADLLPAT
ncbi:MAG TPA: transglutaminase family protein [Mycobacteriales bacterium]|nr:transglutaminase family protein [Mycobacteriales bacterium]